jgi:predicted RNA-binding Zn-ribbon protein involved in translation (DUF1610 family)
MEQQGKKFPCRSCGADLNFDPGSSTLKCPYCGVENEIQQSQDAIEELDFQTYLNQQLAAQDEQEILTVKCSGCGAETTLPPNVTSDLCPYCGTVLIASNSHTTKIMKPKSLLPFHVAHNQALQNLTAWINGLWFAPNRLKHEAEKDKLLKGMYVPYWTYDCNTSTSYTGERGEHYWDTETVMVNGKRETRRVQKTRWYPARGTVQLNFDDVLVLASNSMPRNYADQLQPWDLNNLVAYQEDYLAGFRTESYQVDLASGFEIAKQIMETEIHTAICRDIGGDVQRVHSANSSYSDITFKHILLPVWIGAYRYQGKVYQFQVNARSGEVQGSRPWSWIKIALLVGFIILVLIILISLTQK